MTKWCDCASTNGWVYATPGGWIPCGRCGGSMKLPAPADRSGEAGETRQGLDPKGESAVLSDSEAGDQTDQSS